MRYKIELLSGSANYITGAAKAQTKAEGISSGIGADVDHAVFDTAVAVRRLVCYASRANAVMLAALLNANVKADAATHTENDLVAQG